MSWQIPTQVEQDIIAGKATYRTFQTGNGGQSILPVPANAYVVIDDDIADMYATSTGGFTGGWPYFIPIPRALTGQDTIILRVTNSSGASQILNVTVWYRNEL